MARQTAQAAVHTCWRARTESNLARRSCSGSRDGRSASPLRPPLRAAASAWGRRGVKEVVHVSIETAGPVWASLTNLRKYCITPACTPERCLGAEPGCWRGARVPCPLHTNRTAPPPPTQQQPSSQRPPTCASRSAPNFWLARWRWNTASMAEAPSPPPTMSATSSAKSSSSAFPLQQRGDARTRCKGSQPEHTPATA